jgi:5-bromo-4-chloroindolyl phosphate hydrolysis protein
MELATHEEREVRAARNQALFRAVNEQMTTLNEAFAQMVGTFAVACECADTSCVEMIEIAPEQYRAVRAEPRRFVVHVGHVYPDVEVVVHESPAYVVVEKVAAAAEMAELLAQREAAS